MKTLVFYFKAGLEQLWKEKRCSAILILTTTVTFTAIMVLFRIFFFNIGSWEELQMKRCTYDFEFCEPSTKEVAAGSKAALQWLIESDEVPSKPQISYLRGRTIEYILSSYWENGQEMFVATQWIFNAIDNNKEIEQEVDVLEGRYFLPEEVEKGKNVVLLSKPICELDNVSYNVGDELVLEETTYEIVGFVSNMAHYMPLRTILKAEDMDVLFESLQFQAPLNSIQETALYERFTPFCKSIKNLYDEEMTGVGKQIISYLTSSLLLLGICAVTLVRLLRYLWFSKRHEYAIYRLCGARRGEIRWILCLQIISFCLISAILAIGVYQALIPILDYYEIGMG